MKGYIEDQIKENEGLQECPECNGSGIQEFFDSEKICPLCEGTGLIEINTNIDKDENLN